MVERRRNFMIASRFVDPASFVFLDESGAKTNMTRLYDRAPIGERCFDRTPHGHWRTMTMLSAIRKAGVMEDATVVFDGPMDGITFLTYLEQYLVPTLQPGDVVVMDNLASHKVKGMREAIKSAGCDLWYLPPDSPDLNLIEKLWSKVKAWLRRVSAVTYKTLWQAIAAALRAADPDECANYLASSGYGD